MTDISYNRLNRMVTIINKLYCADLTYTERVRLKVEYEAIIKIAENNIRFKKAEKNGMRLIRGGK